MKKMTVSLLALTALVGGTMLASAAAKPGDIGATYSEQIVWSNSPPTLISDVGFPAPQSTTNFTLFSQSVNTDGSGKVEGAAVLRLFASGSVSTLSTNFVTNGDSSITTNVTTNVTTSGTGFSDFVIDVSGKIGSKKGASTVSLSLKGNGYSSGASNSDFANVSTDAKPAKLSLQFSGSSPVVSTTNGDGDITGEQITGTLKGTINPGLKTINGGKTIKINEQAILSVGTFTLSNASFAMVQIGNKIYSTTENDGFIGSGSTTSKGKFTINYKGFGSDHGSSIKLTGTTGSLVTGFTFVGTNTPTGFTTNTVSTVPKSDIEAKGKSRGQSFDVTGGSVLDAVFFDF